MANALGFSYGDVVRNIESVKTARHNREMSKKNTEQADTMVGLRRRAVAGDKSAAGELVALDPAATSSFLNAFKGLSAEAQAEQKKNLDFLGRAAAYVKQSADPAKAYATVRSQLPEEIASQMPEAYDPQYVDWQLAMLTDLDKQIERMHETEDDATDHKNALTLKAEDEAAAIRKEDRSTKAEIVKEERKHKLAVKLEETKAALKEGAAGGRREIKAADESLMTKQAANYFDGIIGPDGEVQLTDPKSAPKLQKLLARAASIFVNGSMTRSEAVEMAADELGYGLGNRSAGPEADNDPLGLRGG